MTRRDTIIVAALVNAGLLIVMFVSALKDQTNEGQVASVAQSSNLMSNERVAISEPKKIIGDEVDAALVAKAWASIYPKMTFLMGGK